MPATARYGLEQARIQLPAIVAQASSGVASVITRHGKPCAAVISIQQLEQSAGHAKGGVSILALRGTGRGLWGMSPSQTVSELRDEWGDA